MKRISILLIIIITFSSSLIFAGPQEDRRIEEEKRNDLRPTKTQRSKKLPVQKQTAAPMDKLDTLYFAQMALRRVTYHYDICKAMVVLKGLEKQYIDLDSQIAFLKEEGLLPKRFQNEFDPMQPLRKGLVAYILRKTLDVKGGLFLRVFKTSERYALTELAHIGIMSTGNTNDIVSGEELSLIITRTANYMATHKK